MSTSLMSTQSVEKLRGRVVVVRSIDDQAITVSGELARIAKPRDEPFECVQTPDRFIERLKEQRVKADLFTFMQELADDTPKYEYHLEWDSQAVVPVTTYDDWWKKQIDAKSRNMIRKAEKSGVELRVVEFDDDLVNGIIEIYNETPVRQGKAFWHYGKDFDTIKREHATFQERSAFIGAFHNGELIGFAKFVRGRNVASLMQIISKIKDRDKAPSNALIAKSVQMCADEGISYLHYGVWSDGGLGLFKTSHAFVRRQVPRYYVPLNLRGRALLAMGLHHPIKDLVPTAWRQRLTPLRQRWNTLRHGAARPSR